MYKIKSTYPIRKKLKQSLPKAILQTSWFSSYDYSQTLRPWVKSKGFVVSATGYQTKPHTLKYSYFKKANAAVKAINLTMSLSIVVTKSSYKLTTASLMSEEEVAKLKQKSIEVSKKRLAKKRHKAQVLVMELKDSQKTKLYKALKIQQGIE